MPTLPFRSSPGPASSRRGPRSSGWLAVVLGLGLASSGVGGAAPAPEPPIFDVPGFETEMGRLADWYRAHRVLGPDTTLWDAWMPFSTLWFDTPQAPGVAEVRAATRERLLRRRMDGEGYVSTQQHEGLAHSEGWPFPLYGQASGAGWMFTTAGVPYGPGFGVRPVTSVEDWGLEGAETVGLDPAKGWSVKTTAAEVGWTSPRFSIDARVAPFLRIKYSARGLGAGVVAWVEWDSEGGPKEGTERRLWFSLPDTGAGIRDLDLPLHQHPAWGGRLTRFRLRLSGAATGGELTLLRVFTAVDSRHNINNALYLQACDDYARWTGDLDFLRENLGRMRLALAWAIREFQIAEKQVVVTPWVGHDGRSGHTVDAQGKRTLHPGVGIGNNYWDLLPFGGEDALATIYYFDALRRMAALERQLERHPEWNLPRGPLRFEPAELVSLSKEMQAAGHERFWSETTGRFAGWRDPDGKAYDYGFTFLNNEAVYYGYAEPPAARAIRAWIDGLRTVEGDTSTGPDIYHWRFGPRATTRRNLETYFWGWSDPGSIPWGGQVQDGGAVLGFSFHDLMARLQVNGPDDAWGRLRQVLEWYGEVQNAGGYRKYYADPARGTLQGGGTAGGLGLDHEFFESVLVPQVLLYGFLGFHPRLDGAHVAPRLPAAWPSLTLRGIRLHDVSLDVTASRDRLQLTVRGTPRRPLRLYTPGTSDGGTELRPGSMEVPLARAPSATASPQPPR